MSLLGVSRTVPPLSPGCRAAFCPPLARLSPGLSPARPWLRGSAVPCAGAAGAVAAAGAPDRCCTQRPPLQPVLLQHLDTCTQVQARVSGCTGSVTDKGGLHPCPPMPSAPSCGVPALPCPGCGGYCAIAGHFKLFYRVLVEHPAGAKTSGRSSCACQLCPLRLYLPSSSSLHKC